MARMAAEGTSRARRVRCRAAGLSCHKVMCRIVSRCGARRSDATIQLFPLASQYLFVYRTSLPRWC